MSFENPIPFIRSLKGAPASILLALLFTRRPMSSQELQRWTGYSEEPVAQATTLLAELGWITALGERGPWVLSGGKQEFLTGEHDALDAGPVSTDSASESSAPQSDEAAQGEPDDDREDENFVRSLYALYDAGIHEPTAGRLARLPHVNPAYISAHVEQANAQGFALGTAIYRIEHAWPLPTTNRVPTVEERIRRFLGDR